jgi:hypothetical protein
LSPLEDIRLSGEEVRDVSLGEGKGEELPLGDWSAENSVMVAAEGEDLKETDLLDG